MSPDRGLALCCALAVAALVLPGCTGAPSRPVAPDAGTPVSAPEAAAADIQPEESSPPAAAQGDHIVLPPPPSTATGLSIYDAFRGGLAEPQCGNAQPRWHKHFAHAPRRLGDPGSDTLALFGHVVETLREARLPTEFALIPFIESGYAPGARSKAGPAGLWQFIGVTARHHGLRIEPGYDARLSPAESTRAAVQYLKTLYDRFDGNWRLTAMAYNAGEYRVLQALRHSGGDAAGVAPGSIRGLPPVTYAYVEKLHALACLIEEAGEQPQWRAGLDHPVPRLQARALEDARSLDAWAARHGQDPATLRRLNPALAGRWPSRDTPWALVPETATASGATAAATAAGMAGAAADPQAATHTVRKGDSAWSIARRYGVSPRHLLELNGLRADSVLRPGMVLRVQ
ncbi:transglycosylase SLT domain-containing protein [Pseudoxanthomonas suwonensis]|uniref:LysM domain-containing protein n=1 Tax=Pseudoxanthomonas suwonensis TaxID=314722 RepID=A0A0E3YZR5_9GAMM|nr:transglycosylase SLT domain-containing protein [Pseudoxanthomonas suwonensis]AKC85744.1 hypothetical protein WQ53_02165 [Pseudoxanthomonas suwonensis]